MGQYWKPVNLDKREFVNPHPSLCGLKLWEQVGSHPGTGAALIILLAAMPERRGGGDLRPDEIIGRWAGDRIAIVGDYAENGDIPGYDEIPLSLLYSLLSNDDEIVYGFETFKDISDEVAAVIEYELGGKYVGSGWRHFVRDEAPGEV